MEVIMENFNDIDSKTYRRAKKKAREIRDFYINVSLFCIVIPILIAINLIYMPEFYWFFFPILGWGCGIFFHGMEVFGYNPFLGKGWEERKLKEFIDREKEKSNKYE